MHDFCYFYLITMTDIAKFCPKIMLYFSFQDTLFAQKSVLKNQFYLTLNDFQMVCQFSIKKSSESSRFIFISY